MRNIILASESKRRQRLLKDAGIKFQVLNSNLDETAAIKNLTNKRKNDLVKILAILKATSAILTNPGKLNGDEIILGFDTIVVCKNKIINKPKNKKDALSKLTFLSNKKHDVYTGIAILDLKKKKAVVGYERTAVKMKQIKKKEALDYIKTKEPMDKAGAYAIQGIGKKFVKGISGDYSNVVGLPVKKFLSLLKPLVKGA
ncbi:MAG: septum formation protein Maf [Candidatus Melainabacteria bacterium RIFCSPHIGHO2_02_FULL_34_12]|nr:MAG: septum formation protein Maf [Candidatus Melainabacteria bacterium RIFCSPHIGHO2_02_FULL_34_12]